MPQGADRSQFSSHGYRRPVLMWLPFCSLFICLQAIAGEAFSPVMCPPLTAHEKNQEVSMNDISKAAYAALDRPEVLMSLFHPRPEWGGSQGRTSATRAFRGDDSFVNGSPYFAFTP